MIISPPVLMLSLISDCTDHDQLPQRADQLLSVSVSSSESLHCHTDAREELETFSRGESPQQPLLGKGGNEDGWWGRLPCWSGWKMLAWFRAGSILIGMAAPGEPAHHATSCPVWELICQPAVGDTKSEPLQCTMTQSHCSAQCPVHLHTKLMVHQLVFSQTWCPPCHKEKKQLTDSTGNEPV